MALKNTVAIIGATSTTGAFIAKGISKGPYRLLLMDCGEKQLSALKNHIFRLNSNADAEVLQCCKEASWEADIIVVAVAAAEQKETAEKMKEVATCKIVLSIHSLEGEDFQALLPHAKVINVLVNGVADQAMNSGEPMDVVLEGNDEEALATAVEMMKTIGLTYQVKNTKDENRNTKEQVLVANEVSVGNDFKSGLI